MSNPDVASNESSTPVKDAIDTTGVFADSLEYMQLDVNNFISELDPRIAEYYSEALDRLATKNGTNYYDMANGYKSWLQQEQQSEMDFDEEMAQLPGQIPTGDFVPVVPANPISLEDVRDLEYTINPDVIANLPAEVLEAIKLKLDEAGFTPAEIEDILNGKVPVNNYTLEKITDAITDVCTENKEVQALIQEVFGFDIFNEDGKTISPDKLAIAMIISGKNLGMDIDLRPGSDFRKYLSSLSVELQRMYNTDPSIRQKIIDMYGIDIFDADGKIDYNKLALLKIIDGGDLKDKYDLEKVFGINLNRQNNPSTGNNTSPNQNNTNNNQNNNTNNNHNNNQNNNQNNNENNNQKNTQQNRETTGNNPTLASTALAQSTAGIGAGGASANGVGTANSGTFDALEGNMAKLAEKVSPYAQAVVGVGAGAGAIAAAGAAVASAATGGGLLARKGLKTIKFTPKDWEALGTDLQQIVEKLMKDVGFAESELKLFKTSNFKILESEINGYINDLKKAISDNPSLPEEFMKLYNYSIFEDNDKINYYLLFITLIVDGNNKTDKYNMYNLINESLTKLGEVDYLYSGIAMLDYLDDSSESEEIPILDDGKIDNSEPLGDLEEAVPPAQNKEWLQGIGMDE